MESLVPSSQQRANLYSDFRAFLGAKDPVVGLQNLGEICGQTVLARTCRGTFPRSALANPCPPGDCLPQTWLATNFRKCSLKLRWLITPIPSTVFLHHFPWLCPPRFNVSRAKELNHMHVYQPRVGTQQKARLRQS